MDREAFYDISSGLYYVSAHNGEQRSACIINTFLQVASMPKTVIIALNNDNYTKELVAASHCFHVSILKQNTDMDFIKNFGFQSGREVDKFVNYQPQIDEEGNPYLKDYAVSDFICEVIDTIDLSSHTLFIATIKAATKNTREEVLTYAYYQKHLKGATPKNAVSYDHELKGKYRCQICGYVALLDELPADYKCPICGAPAQAFKKDE